MQFNDDDIEFLGGENYKPPQSAPTPAMQSESVGGKPRFRWHRFYLAIIAVLVVVCGIFGWKYYREHRWAVYFDYSVSRPTNQIIADLGKSLAGDGQHGVGATFKVDSIDGVPMRLLDLTGSQVSIAQRMPADSDSTVFLVTHAWDWYYDESHRYHYLGDVVIDGKRLGYGSGKAGFVVVTPQGWQMGIGQDDAIVDYAMAQHGSMFRQFALVSNGEICLKQFALKGKVYRRALARKRDSATACFVETIHKESLFDFAQALSDYGFVDAIYISRADGKEPYYRDAQGQLHGDVQAWHQKKSLMVFRWQNER